MFNLKNLASAGALACTLFTASAQAAPIYHVSLDTAGQSGQGLMDFTFLANLGAPAATALVSNFSGAFGAQFDRSTSLTGGLPGAVSFSNQNGGDYLTHYVQLGGLFSFDVSFAGSFATTESIDASQFNVTLYDDLLSGYIGAPGSFVEFSLLPQIGGVAGQILANAPNPMASLSQAAEVSEPGSMWTVLTALAIFGWSLRRQPRRFDKVGAG